MTPLLAILLLVGFLGHVIFWASIVNRVHGLAIPRLRIDLITLVCGLAMAGMPLAVGGVLWAMPREAPGSWWQFASGAAWGYVGLGALYFLFAAARRLQLAIHPERRAAILANHTDHLDLKTHLEGPLTAPGFATWLCRVPGNQALGIQFHEKQLRIPRLPAECDGLRIAHLSDLHMSGRITQDYFHQVADRVNAWEADLVAVTGDLVENEACVDWIPDTLGRLRASGGVYYVLGNHDLRVDAGRLNEVLASSGLVHLGGAWRELSIGPSRLVLAGNELPWFGPAADMTACPPRDAAGLPLRVLLAHGPDQFPWAQQHDFDLMLAGHNHGGQIRLPLLGPFLAPSVTGVRYASGVFQSGSTVLHVSRGTSSKTPLRWNCAPEVALLVLRAGG